MTQIAPSSSPPRWLIFLLIFGLYLTLRGYQSREGDQAYRLPLLLHRQDPALFADDPFVRAFDAFNPHRGSLALLDAASRAVGLSAALAGLFALTFAATALGLDRLARASWPEAGPRVGVVAVVLVLVARAGNIGTNHLFEPMLLDRLIGFGLGWVALGAVVADPRRGWWISSLMIVAAALVHPSVGLQLAMLLGAGWVGCSLRPGRTGVDRGTALRGLAALGLALVPAIALNAGQGGRLFAGLPPEEFRLLSVELQGPQHMLPHLWRLPQWLAWGCYPLLALLALGRVGRPSPSGCFKDAGPPAAPPPQPSPTGGEGERNKPSPPVGEGWVGGVRSRIEAASEGLRSQRGPAWPSARARLAVLLAINLAGIGLAWVAVEVVGDLRVTVFQPFRMATVLRGLALVALSGRIVETWRRGGAIDRARAVLLMVGLDGDWSLVVATAFEVAMTALDEARLHGIGEAAHPRLRWVVGSVVLGAGLAFLARHDTESGHLPLAGALVALAVGTWATRGRSGFSWNRRRLAWGLAVSWAVPLAALVAGCGFDADRPWVRALVARCRFAAVPADDIERLAVWCRDHTPGSSRFIGPPGPKTFRLWSARSLAFNRAASPYHAEGLADWSARFRDHVGFSGPTAAFVRAYQDDRHGLERRFQDMSPGDLAALARRQGASHVIAPPSPALDAGGPLERLHAEGRYAVYRVVEDRIGLRRVGSAHRP
jgi:hypothetical protein